MKIDNQTTAIGFAKRTAATMQTMADAIQVLSKKIIENSNRINELEMMIGQLKGDQYLTDNRVDKIEKNPTLFDK